MTRPLPIRPGDHELPDDALVVRGGRLNILDIAEALETSFEVFGVYGFSICAAQVADLEALCRLAQTRLPHLVVCSTTVGRLRRVEGVELLPTFDAPHYTLAIPDTDGHRVRSVIDAFDEPVDNTVTLKRRRR